MIGAEAIIKALEDEGTDFVFGYPGGAIMPVYDQLPEARFQHILVRHEQGAALAADGYARASGKVGVCLATSGPGATNLLTGIANAYLDSVPMLCLTGQVSSQFMGTDAFQEIDIFGLCHGIVKHSMIARSADQLYAMIREGFAIAREGRPGPVLIDLPKDVTLATITQEKRYVPAPRLSPGPSEQAYAAARQLIRQAERPLIYAGGGIGIAKALSSFRHFVKSTRIPVVSTLKGLGNLDTDHPLHLGMLGMHGLKAANYAVQNCDVLIAVGVRFDDRATGKLESFAPLAKVIHLDIDPCEIDKNRRVEVRLLGDLNQSLSQLTNLAEKPVWLEQCMLWKESFRWDYERPGDGIFAPRLLKQLSDLCHRKTIVTADVGQHQMWLAQHFRFHAPQEHLSSGGLGTMGYGLPAAIGAQLSDPEALLICCTGDGSIMMNIQELATLNRYQLPVKILLFDNQRLGMVKQWQELFFNKRFSSVDLSDNPDFCGIAKSCGLAAMMIDHRRDELSGIEFLLHQKGPALLHVRIDPEANVWPLVPPGASNLQMMEA